MIFVDIKDQESTWLMGIKDLNGIDSFQTLYSNDLDHGDFISQTLTTDEITEIIE